MEVKILILILSFVLYESVVSQVIESSTSDAVINTNYPFNTPFNRRHRRPIHLYLSRPLGPGYADQNNSSQNWISSFPDRFPFYNNRLNNRLMPFNIGMRRPMHNHMINIPSQSQLGTSTLDEYLNRLNTPHRFGTFTKPNTSGNHMNKPTHIWYRPHGTESSVGLLNQPPNKPCHSQAPETSVVVSKPSGPISDQAVNTMNHEHHDNTNNSNSNPPKEIQEDSISDDSSPEIDIRGGFDG